MIVAARATMKAMQSIMTSILRVECRRSAFRSLPSYPLRSHGSGTMVWPGVLSPKRCALTTRCAEQRCGAQAPSVSSPSRVRR